jgi:gamma-glutamyltranspeptidase/glutathione hydrolase
MDDGLSLEPGIDRAAAADLAKLGHDVRSGTGGFGGYEAIQIDWERGVLIGGTDPRKDGQVATW